MNKVALKDALHYVHEWLEYQFPLLDVPSISVAVSLGDEIVYAKAFGDADKQTSRSATPKTTYRFASHSKMFTAVALLQLQEAGKLKLDDTVIKYLPWLKDHQDKRWLTITLRQLLSHGAGIMRDGSMSGFWVLQRPFPDRKQLQQDILDTDLVLDPAKTMKYSNYGFGLLGLVVEAVSGDSYNKYVTQNIIQKMRLEDTAPELPDHTSDQLAACYTSKRTSGRTLAIDHCDTKALSSATGFCSTPSDICLFMGALYDGRLLADASLREMTKVHQAVDKAGELVAHYGLGLEIGTIADRKVYGHGGGFPGTRSSSRHDPASKISVSVVNNDTSIASTLLIKSIFNCIYWFDKYYVEHPAYDMTRFSGRFGTLWGVSDVIGYGNTIINFFPRLPLEFNDATQLKRLDDTTLEITDSDSFGNLGERIRYSFDQAGRILSIDESGKTILPLSSYQKALAKRDRISLP